MSIGLRSVSESPSEPRRLTSRHNLDLSAEVVVNRNLIAFGNGSPF
ncbi:MAG: hypothetical protein K2I90_07895 [Odoribacter sp.]|nr:hypothetical protein [Odoribacter sp.]